jgi:hypothetical protein
MRWNRPAGRSCTDTVPCMLPSTAAVFYILLSYWQEGHRQAFSFGYQYIVLLQTGQVFVFDDGWFSTGAGGGAGVLEGALKGVREGANEAALEGPLDGALIASLFSCS